MIGRDDELAKLGVWLDSPKPISVRVLTGRAGAGKTRLALEMIEMRLAEGWDAGVVTARELKRFFGQQNLQSWYWQRPTLVVIDYAAIHAEAIYDWLSELSDHSSVEGKPLRLLLLERSASMEAGWWRPAFGYSDGTAKAIQRLLDPMEPIALPPIDRQDIKRGIFQAALNHGQGDLKVPTPGEDAYFDQRLKDLTWGGEPLFLMMAGLLGAKHGVRQVLALARTDLAFDLAERELERIGRAGGDNPSRKALLRHMAAYVTLCYGLSKAALIEAIEEERHATMREGAGDAASLADLLTDALPGAPGEVAPILPDVIGEAACLFTMRDDTPTVVRAFKRDPTLVAAAAIRAAEDFGGTALRGDRTEAPLAWIDSLVDECRDDFDQLAGLADLIPQNSIVLASRGYQLHSLIGQILQGRVDRGDKSALADLAMSLDSRANRLSDLGFQENALEAAEEAVAIYRTIEGGKSDLARALNNSESVELYADLVGKSDGFFHVPGYARALYNKGNIFDCQGHHSVAETALLDALNIYRELSADLPDSFRSHLALTLTLLGIVQENLGKNKEALEKSEEAVRINEEIAAVLPDEHLPNLAGSLSNLANRLTSSGSHIRARDNAQRAVSIFRELAESMPGAFAHSLANSLTVLGRCTWNSGSKESAIEFFEEAMEFVVLSLENVEFAYEHLLRSIVKTYAGYSKKMGRDPRQELLDRVKSS